MKVSVLNFLHHSRTVLEADLVSSSYLGGSIAHTVQYLVKHINLLLAKRLLNGYAELVEIVRKLSGVYFTLILPLQLIKVNRKICLHQ